MLYQKTKLKNCHFKNKMLYFKLTYLICFRCNLLSSLYAIVRITRSCWCTSE